MAAAAVRGRARELSTVALCWQAPEDSTPRSPVRSSRARCSPTTASISYKSAPAEDPDVPPKALERLILASSADLSETVADAALVTNAVNAARDLQNRPGNDLTPTALAELRRGAAPARSRA